MKLYDFLLAPNPRKLGVYLAEKGIEIPKVRVDLTKGVLMGVERGFHATHAVLPGRTPDAALAARFRRDLGITWPAHLAHWVERFRTRPSANA